MESKCGLVIAQGVGCPEAQIPVLALSNKLWANHFTSLGLFPGEVKSLYQLCKCRFKDVSNEKDTEHLPGSSVVLQDFGDRTYFVFLRTQIFFSRMQNQDEF